MYNSPVTPAAGAAAAGMGSGTLAMTGAGDLFWFALAAFAMLALGLAIKRIVPVRAQKNLPTAS
ncbi:hypothetical protein [Paenarthrobacter sp. NPDC089316]|uniref:hypothetical protein n=1 Tax=unclassified Paenarthrobacter TaxID=2634190 RepID=UPI0034128BE3